MINFSNYVSVYKPKIEEAIRMVLEKKIEMIKNRFLKSYYTELKNYLLAGGKRIRPILTIATFNAFSEGKDERIILPSIGIEFLHNATLIHDDIIDNDDFRRGNPAFHYRFKTYHKDYNLKKMDEDEFGNSMGIIGGNTAFTLGLEAYLSNKFEHELNLNATRFFQEAFIEVIEGVLIEIDMINQGQPTIDEYIKMISLKTGVMISKSILIGANYAKTDGKYRKLLSRLGINIGIIFQIIDDILGTFGNEEITGKPTDGDIREGKKTCLLITALNDLSKSNKNKLLKLIENPNMSKKDVAEVKDLFLEAEVAEKCKNLAKMYYNESIEILNELKIIINPEELEFFNSLLTFIMERSF